MEFLKFLAALVIGLSLLFAGAIGFARLINSIECDAYAEMVGLETEMAFTHCYIRTPDGFERFDMYKARAVTNEK